MAGPGGTGAAVVAGGVAASSLLPHAMTMTTANEEVAVKMSVLFMAVVLLRGGSRAVELPRFFVLGQSQEKSPRITVDSAYPHARYPLPRAGKKDKNRS
jgi:hypothetical protein